MLETKISVSSRGGSARVSTREEMEEEEEEEDIPDEVDVEHTKDVGLLSLLKHIPKYQ